MAWEQGRLDDALADAFGFHALQLGLPFFEGLRANRMPSRWVAASLWPPEMAGNDPATEAIVPRAVALSCGFDALPFPDQSIDLVVLPHTLELAADPHATLREVERVLVPEGRVAITGFNAASLWGLRQRTGQARRGVGMAAAKPPFMPRTGEFINYWRLRDWLRLLGFEIEAGRFGCWRPPATSERWLERWAWIDPVGERWWPVLGAVYFVSARKRVRGMRLVGLAKNERRAPKAAPAVAAHREPAEAES